MGRLRLLKQAHVVYANPTIQQQQEDETLLFHYGYVVIVKYIRSAAEAAQREGVPSERRNCKSVWVGLGGIERRM